MFLNGNRLSRQLCNNIAIDINIVELRHIYYFLALIPKMIENNAESASCISVYEGLILDTLRPLHWLNENDVKCILKGKRCFQKDVHGTSYYSFWVLDFKWEKTEISQKQVYKLSL